MKPCPAYVDGLVQLALGDPDVEGRDRLEAHLRTCAACRRHLGDIRAALAALGEPVPVVDPPPDLKARVLASYRREQAAPRRDQASPRGRFAPRPERASPRRGWVAGLAAAAVLLLILNAALGAVVWRLRAEVAALTRMVEVSSGQLIVAYDLMRLMNVPADATVDLHSQTAADVPADAPAGEPADAPAAAGAFGRASVYSAGPVTLVLITAWDLPSLPDETAVYQVWLGHDGQRVNAGVFRTDPNGNGVVIYRHPGELQLDSVGITVEPDPYGDAPRGEPVLVGLRGR